MESSGWAPLVLIELVLVFGGVLAFAVWQLRSVERDMQRTREAREREMKDEQPDPGPDP
jgi:Flp pilus assembly protein protease CpaA